MTTVAWRGNEMAADTLGLRGGMKVTAEKIHRVGEYVIGVSGNLSDCLMFVEWWSDRSRQLDFRMYRSDGSDAPDIQAIVIGPDRKEYWTEHLQPTPILDEFFAVGSGAMAAMAAMHMGATPEKAIEVASKVDGYTSDVVQVVKLDAEVVTIPTLGIHGLGVMR